MCRLAQWAKTAVPMVNSLLIAAHNMQVNEYCSNVCKRSDVQVDTVGKDTQWGTGGMVTKLTAARIATAAGCTMVICSSAEPELMPDIIRGKQAGTVFHPLPNAVRYVLTHPGQT